MTNGIKISPPSPIDETGNIVDYNRADFRRTYVRDDDEIREHTLEFAGERIAYLYRICTHVCGNA